MARVDYELEDDRQRPEPPPPFEHDRRSGRCGNRGYLVCATGRPAETALCVAFMMMSGLFDRFPKLRIILAHMGAGS